MMKLVSEFNRKTFVFVLLTLGLMLFNVVNAQQRLVLSSTEFTIKPGHSKQFEEGIKAWKACYAENDGKWNWDMWRRYNGKGTVYVLTSHSQNWAQIDHEDEAAKKCMTIVQYQIVPHIESAEDNFARTMPDISKNPESGNSVIWVNFFRVKNSTVFMEIVGEIGDYILKAEGNKRGYWYSASGGGPGSADYFVVTPFKNFAALDVERDGIWKIVENAKGKEYTDQLREKFRNSIEDSWSYIYKHIDELSNNQAQ